MSDAANDTISLMMKFGGSVVPAAEHLAEILLDAVQTLLKRGTNLGNERAGQLVNTLKNRIDGIGEHGQVTLKNLAKQDRELMVIPVERDDLQTLKNQLKSYQVDFAIQEDALTEDISVHVKAQDLARIEEALKGIIRSTVNEKQVDLMTNKEVLSEDKNSSYDFGDMEHAKEAEAQLAEVDSDMPATDKQMNFIGSLMEKGIVSAEEMDQLKENQTVEQANALLNAHRDDAGFINLGSVAGDKETGNEMVGIAEYDWDKERPGALIGDEQGTRHPDGTYEPTMKSEKVTASGHILQAYSNGRAAVLDNNGSTVWSACGIGGNIDASKRLADRGLEAYQQKESLHLSPQTPEHDGPNGDALAFEAKLDKAEATAAIEAGKMMNQRQSPERERNAR